MSLFVSTHPLTVHKLTKLRSVNTKPKQFRELIEELAILLAYEATRELEIPEKVVATPLGECKGKMFQEPVGLVPILRAGLGMLEGMLKVVPFACVWHLGLYRNEETLQPVTYYNKMREDQVANAGTVLVLDPMLATGGSVTAAIKALKDKGAKKIKVVSIIGAPEGVKRVHEEFPDVDIYLAGLDQGLNEQGYIFPGLGDAGDRQYGTV